MKKLLFLCMAIAATAFFSSGTAQAIPDPCGSIGYAAGCNVIITLKPLNSFLITPGDPTPYDNQEDQLVGVINNSGGQVSNLSISGTGIFDFSDGDGAGSPNCDNGGGTGNCPYNFSPTGYEGPTTTFDPTDANNGRVLFTGNLANGGTAWFSLENSFIANSFSVTGVNIPEPGSLLLLGAGLAGLVLWGRKQAA